MTMRIKTLALAAGSVTAAALPLTATAQQAAPPPAAGQAAPVPALPAGQQLPPVDVIQKQAPTPAPKQQAAPQPKVQPTPAAPKAAAAPQTKAKPKAKAAAPAPQPAPPPVVAAEPEPVEPTGATRSSESGRLITTARPTSNPVNADSLIPENLQNYSGAATRVNAAQIEAERPTSNMEALASVPGVVTVTDDGFGRHVGVGIRGSNFRRARKVLMLEDGVPINFSTYIDASTHYTPPTDRIETIEVVRGTIFAHGPLTNHGMVNFQNLSPFGPSETMIKAAIIHTDGVDDSIGNYRHVHTRQMFGNVGIVASYSGSETSGAWDNERLRFNDFYGAIGWKGSDQDLTIAAVYNRQRDNYDEDNFVGTRQEFAANGRRKLASFGDDTGFNTYNADLWSVTATHNWYINDDTTVSTRIYTREIERNRLSARDGGPLEGVGLTDPGDADDIGHMRGRNRIYGLYGADSRLELANRPFLFGMTQDILTGIRYEYQSHRRCTAFGLRNQVLDDGNTGNCRAVADATDYVNGIGFNDDGSIEKFEASAFAAFLQTSIHVTNRLSITPGIRYENYEIERRQVFDGGPINDPAETSKHEHVLPGVAVAWEFMPRTTLYGGYHRGFAPHLSVEASGNFPLEEEVGDNFQVGVRSTPVKGLSFDVAYFHSFIDNYQLKEAFTDDTGADVYGLLDKVEIKGIELGARLDSRPFTGGPFNVFTQATYTFTDARIERGQDAIFEDLPLTDVSGNRLPFSIRHYANLTFGFDYKKVFDASLTWTYRGSYFTNPQNSNDLTCIDDSGNVDVGCTGALDDPDEMVGGKVGGIWTLSARSNLKLSETMTLFLSGHNLTNEFYIADLQDGAKPGQGRTIMGGFTLKLD